MEIQRELKSDSEDSWDPKQYTNPSKSEFKSSLFQKITIIYDDQEIQKKVEAQCEKPILNSQFFPFKDDQDGQQINHQETQQQQRTNYQTNSKIQEKNRMQNEQKPNKKEQQNSMQNEEALFNAVQDQQNDSWMRKKLRNQHNAIQSSKMSRPLTCPQCFTQICYNYQACRQNIQEKIKQNANQFLNTKPNQKTYKTRFVQNVTIHEHKIIRNRFASQNMQKKMSHQLIINSQNFKIKSLESYQKDLKNRYQDINVKILMSCMQCGLDLGYWDANKQMYLLFNVI